MILLDLIYHLCEFPDLCLYSFMEQGLQDKIKVIAVDRDNRPAWYKEKVYPANKVEYLIALCCMRSLILTIEYSYTKIMLNVQKNSARIIYCLKNICLLASGLEILIG